MPPIFAGQAIAANANSNGNGRSGDNNGDGGRSANAGSDSSNASSSEGPASGRGNGGGLLRLLTSGSAKPSSTGGTSTAGVAADAPQQLLPPQANGAAADIAGIGSPDPKPVAPVTAYVMEMAEVTGQKPGEIHRLLGAGHSYFNSDEHAKQNAAPNSRIKRVERYLQANAVAQAALAAIGGVAPTDAEYAEALAYLEAQAYLDAVAVVEAPAGTHTPEEITAAQGLIDSSSFADAAEAQGVIDASLISADQAQAIVDAYEALAAAVVAFEEADNRPYDEVRRAVYDDLATFLGITF